MEINRVRQVLIVLDLQSIELTSSQSRSFTNEMQRMSRQLLGDEVRVIRRVYAPEEKLSLALQMGRRNGWRQGGNGKANEIADYIISDARALCLRCPSSSTLILCSTNPDLTLPICGLRERGVEVILVRGLRFLAGATAASDYGIT